MGDFGSTKAQEDKQLRSNWTVLHQNLGLYSSVDFEAFKRLLQGVLACLVYQDSADSLAHKS